MPFAVQNYPHWAVVAVRTVRILAYTFASLSGVSAVVFTPASITPDRLVFIASMAIFGLVCLIGTVFQQYVVEWISLFFLAGGLTVYTVGLWIGTLTSTQYVTASCVMTMIILLLVVRLIDLTVYWLKVVRIALISKGLAHDR